MIDPALLHLIDALAAGREGPVLIGIAGAQGSGKTTLARAAAARADGVALSLDDVYLARAERARLAASTHPLLAVRGPPGTHDLELADAMLDDLLAGRPALLPRFDKLADDRAEPERFAGGARVVLMDGWCLGATPQADAALARPVNALEREQDPDRIWRGWVNAALASRYQRFFGRFDAIVHLAAPDFDTVLDWRCEQEAGLMGLAPGDLPAERREAIAEFIQHFERITRHMLAGGVAATVTVRLDAGRRVVGFEPA
ncbi:MAG: kinase [Caulobacter sp.]|nr:kinase [Caulobacter sp.]